MIADRIVILRITTPGSPGVYDHVAGEYLGATDAVTLDYRRWAARKDSPTVRVESEGGQSFHYEHVEAVREFTIPWTRALLEADLRHVLLIEGDVTHTVTNVFEPEGAKRRRIQTVQARAAL